MFLGLKRKEKSCDRNAEKNFFVDSIKSSELNLKEKKEGWEKVENENKRLRSMKKL